VGEIVVTVVDAAVLGQLLDAHEHDPDACPPLRDLLDVDAAAPTTGLAVHTPGTLGVKWIGCWRPTYDRHRAIRRAIVEAGKCAFEHSTDDLRDRAAVGGALPSTTMVELVESRIRDLIRGDP
jgi:hypothetical protein